MLLLCLFPVSASAHTGIDLDRLGSMTLHMTYDKKPVSGGNLLLYRVADVVEEDGNYAFALIPELAKSKISLDKLDDKALPKKLLNEVTKAGLPVTVGFFDEKGQLSFKDLKLGLYLVAQTSPAKGFECIQPVLITLPMQDGKGGYLYDIDATPKPELKKVTVTPSPTPTPPPKLPQTGQLNWPVPVLAGLGALLIVLGLLLRLSARRDERKTR